MSPKQVEFFVVIVCVGLTFPSRSVRHFFSTLLTDSIAICFFDTKMDDEKELSKMGWSDVYVTDITVSTINDYNRDHDHLI